MFIGQHLKSLFVDEALLLRIFLMIIVFQIIIFRRPSCLVIESNISLSSRSGGKVFWYFSDIAFASFLKDVQPIEQPECLNCPWLLPLGHWSMFVAVAKIF
jgi:hypothetical protein